MRQNLWPLNESVLLAFFGGGKMSDPPAIMEVQAQRAKEAAGMDKTQNGRYVVGDRLLIEAEVMYVTVNGQGMQLAAGPNDGPDRRLRINVSQRLPAQVTERVHKTAGQLLWESVREEAITRPEGAHPTQPWENLLPATQEKYETQAAKFLAAATAR